MRTAKQPARLAALFILLTVLAGCAGTDGASSRSATPLTTGLAAGTPTAGLQGGLPGPTGPKKRIAVAKFDAAGAFMAQYGGWDIGGGLAAQLTTALVNSGYFIVVERAELTPVLREQDMAMQKIVSKETAALVGRILGAQLLVAGSVTEFDQRAGGGPLRDERCGHGAGRQLRRLAEQLVDQPDVCRAVRSRRRGSWRSRRRPGSRSP